MICQTHAKIGDEEMPTTYAHDLFGKNGLPAAAGTHAKDRSGKTENLFRIGLHGPDILFYFMVTPNPVTANRCIRMHTAEGCQFF